jgi:hypothetical protein
METGAGIKDTARKLLFPAAVSAVGGGVGWLLSRNPKQLRQAIPQMPDVDVGNLKDDLRGRLDFVLGKQDEEAHEEQADSHREQRLDPSKFVERRQERQKRREERKQRLNA